MSRLPVFLLLALAAVPAHFVTAQGLPARPVPFTFVTDQASLLAPADAQKLESGLRRYADQNGTQVVVVTVPSLGGRDVADYGRALGTAWGVGQRDKNNGLVVLLSGQEHKVTIQAGSGLRSVITPDVTSRVINQQMLPSFKQGNYFAGLRAGLNTLMLAANPSSDPRRTAPAGSPAGSAGSDNFPALGGADATATNNPTTYETPATTETSADIVPAPAPEIPGPGIGTILIGVLLIGGVGFLLLKLFRRKAAAGPTGGNAPDFYGNQPNRNSGNPGNYNGPVNQGSSGSGIGGMLATGAAAAAGAYLGNRMASGHDSDTSRGLDNSGVGLGAGAASTSTGPDYFSDNDNSPSAAPDYFSSDDNSSSSSDNASYDDSSSGDTGGGGFDGGDTNSGSW